MRRPFLSCTLASAALALAACTGGETSPVGVDLLPRGLLSTLRVVVSTRFQQAVDFAVFPAGRAQAERLTTAHDWPTPDGFESRALFRFHVAALDSLPAGTELGEPMLRLVYAAPSIDVTFALYRVTSEWTEDGATWTQRDFGRPWATPGGDFDPVPVARFTVSAAPEDTTATVHVDSIRIPIAPELLAGWRSGQFPNDGLILVQETAGVAVDLGSRGADGSNPNGPTLEMETLLPDDVTAELRLLAQEDVFAVVDRSPFPSGDLVVRGGEPPMRVVLVPTFEDLPPGGTLASFQLVMTVRAVDLPRDSLMIFGVPLQSEFRGEATFFSLTSVLSPFAVIRPETLPGDTVIFESPVFTALARRWITSPETNRGLGLRLVESGPISESVIFGGAQFYGLDAPAELRPRFRAVIVPSLVPEDGE